MRPGRGLLVGPELEDEKPFDDAEVIEHVLGEDVVRELERTLNHASIDPHGRPIPGLADMSAGLSPDAGPGGILGYGGRL